MAGSSSAFRKHGTFVYEVDETVHDYGDNAKAIAAMKNAEMTHAWVRIHNATPYGSAKKKIIKQFIDDLKAAGIAVAGWGWCQGEDSSADAKMAADEVSHFQLTDYIADIENGVHDCEWTASEVENFCKKVRPKIAGSFGITTFPLIDWHEPELMKAALPYVDMFNPQVYWLRFPRKDMVKEFKRPNGQPYKLNNAAEYADLCIDRWDTLMGGTPKDLVITGEAYWGEGKPPMTQLEAEDKLDEFLAAWNGFNRVIGLNWWHFGGSKAMKNRMLTSITNAHLGSKPYK